PEAIAMLEQDGFVKTVPRRGIVVVRRTKTEIVDMIRAWAALESMAARPMTTTARKKDITALRDFFKDFGKDRLPQDHIEEYSKANIAFHQALISLSESQVLVDMTNDILLHVRGYRQLTIGRKDRTATSLPEHRGIIDALKLNGISTIYGVPGIPITDLGRMMQAEGIRVLSFRHEQNAGYAASIAGYLTKKPGICLTVSAPGFLNGLTALAHATTNC